MASVSVCCVCDHRISFNSNAIECGTCSGWCHSSYSGLSIGKFGKIAALVKKKKLHNWKCLSCKDVNGEKNNNDVFCQKSMVIIQMQTVCRKGQILSILDKSQMAK